MAHRKGHKSHGHDHTGPVHHPHMTHRLKGHGKDPHASEDHHAMNEEHDMEHGMTPEGGACTPGEYGMEEGGEGMAGNAHAEG